MRTRTFSLCYTAAREKGLLEEIANSIPVVYVNIALH